ncbi:DUF2785 domain-containing protein [Streptomyces sp. CB01881]|uniref:DUF2785 domain-containing protein n=1 Tax=Streptomyces sp. CB01881 TaxID=2078691 RepID=UPI000CDCCC3C|nr:DUF2785 domain-containing protein [Streptomyces sp. CB01881]AUY51821.1 hypothetical protein C2142_26150 [Streptomyces sp. CB01881]TYC71249.1 DUF2785 domain-containing protein [Streptomyces sp. CB01881]
MINWTEIETAEPTPELLAAVSGALRSPDPQTRDSLAYEQLCRWIPRLAPPELYALGDEMAERLADPEIQARTFAPLILADLVDAGAYRPAWLDAFARWYPAETDLRGWDQELGWLHAVAHGADLLAALGRSPLVTDPEPLLELAAARLLAPTDHVWDAMEDDRLGRAVALVLTRPGLTERQALAWLDPIAAQPPRRPTASAPGVAATLSNTLRTLRVVYVLADRGVRPARGAEPLTVQHCAALRARIAALLVVNSPFTG